MARAIVEQGGDYLLALRRDQPSLHGKVAAYFDAPLARTAQTSSVEKDHGRLATRTTWVSHDVDWLSSDRRHPGEPRFPDLKALIKTATRVEYRDGRLSEEVRCFIGSAPQTPDRVAQAVRARWGIGSLHWVLNVVSNKDQSRLRKGRGDHNMALVRHLAFIMVRAGKGKRSIKTARKATGWNPDFLASIITPNTPLT